MISKFQLNCYSIFVYKMYISNLNSCKGAAGWNALSPKVTLWLSVQWTHHQHHHHGCGHDHKDRGGSWWRLNRREGKAPAARPKPFLATCSPAHPMWRVPFVLKITWMILGEGYKSGKDFWMLILKSNEQTLQRVMFSKSTCNVLFKLFDVALFF